MTNLRMFLLQPSVVLACRVAQSSFTYPLTQITFDTVSQGSYTAVRPGMTIVIGSTPGGSDLGRHRIRANPTSSILYIARSSQGTNDGELSPVDNAYITVLNDYRVWAKVPYITPAGVVFKDWNLDAAGNVGNPPPLANGGCGFAGTADSITGYARVEFSAVNSTQFDQALSSNIAGVSVFNWSLVDGVVISGATNQSVVRADFPAGFRYVSLTVTSDAGITHTTRIPVYVRNAASDTSITNFQVTNHNVSNQGQELSLRVLQDIPASTYPDGTLVMIWDDDLQTYTIDRPHMLFVGWHVGDNSSFSQQRTASLYETTLRCVDVIGRLKLLQGYTQFVQNTDPFVPNRWDQTYYPNLAYYFWYLLYYHSTALEVAPLTWGTTTLSLYEFRTLGSDEGTLFEQVNSLAMKAKPDYFFNCSPKGEMRLVRDPNLLDDIARPTAIMQLLDSNSWTSYEQTVDVPPRIRQLISYALISNKSTFATPSVVFSIAPGDEPGQGNQFIENPEGIVQNQFTLNVTEGHRYAKLNSRYGGFTINLPYEELDLDFDLSTFGWVQLGLPATVHTYRGFAPSAVERGIVYSMTINYNYGKTGLVRTATLNWTRETYGQPAVTGGLQGNTY